MKHKSRKRKERDGGNLKLEKVMRMDSITSDEALRLAKRHAYHCESAMANVKAMERIEAALKRHKGFIDGDVLTFRDESYSVSAGEKVGKGGAS